MKKTIGVLFALAVLSAMIFLGSCSTKDPTTGNLHITIIYSVGNPVSAVRVHIATTRENQEQGVYLKADLTDGSGNIRFMDLLPGYYWYGVDGWNDYGAVQVYAGIDQYVYLLLNSPILPKK